MISSMLIPSSSQDHERKILKYSEWVIVVELHYGENKLSVNEMMMRYALYQTNTLSWNVIVLADRNVTHYDTLSWFWTGRSDHMVVEFTTTYAISAYHHYCCEFESRSGRGVQHYVIKFVSDLRHLGGFLRAFRFSPPIKLTVTI
jgi:hypothetical protein